jgi:hypothetical protein
VRLLNEWTFLRSLKLCDKVGEFVMSCPSCNSENQVEFAAEMVIHFAGLNNLDKPGVMVFPKILVCLGCGHSRFTVPSTELARLGKAAAANQDSSS